MPAFGAAVALGAQEMEFDLWLTKDGELVDYKPEYESKPMFEEEIDAFLRAVQEGERQPSHIDTVIITARMMQALYDSSEAGREIVLD